MTEPFNLEEIKLVPLRLETRRSFLSVAAAEKTYLFGSFRGGVDFFAKVSI